MTNKQNATNQLANFNLNPISPPCDLLSDWGTLTLTLTLISDPGAHINRDDASARGSGPTNRATARVQVPFRVRGQGLVRARQGDFNGGMECPAREVPRHCLWRYTWTVLRSD
jgi:hypothetical protein